MSKGSVNLPSLLTGYYGQSSNNSSAFQTLLRGLAEANSKLEEDRLIKREIKTLKEKISKPVITPKQMKEYLVRLIYCEMLGHEVEFGYFHAAQFAQQPGLMEKRVGYLAVSLFLHENHEFIMLLVNTLQKDLKSSNMLEVCAALTVVCKLINAEMIPALLPDVLKLLVHERELVRKKAVMALYRFYIKAPSQISDIKDIAKRALRDGDPGVIAAALYLFKHLIQVDTSNNYKDLVPSFVAILKQIVDKTFHKEFEYNGTMAPWMCICLLQILAQLGKDDLKSSENMYEVLGQAMRGAAEKTIACAVLYECLKTVATIYPNPLLIQAAMRQTSPFLNHALHDLKYLGINTMATLLRIQPDTVVDAEVQSVIIDCLIDEDETLKRKTLDLLCHITNSSNVEVVCEKLLSFLRSTNDTFFREGLVTKITELAEKFAPDTVWYLNVMNEVFELGGSLVREEVAHNLMRLIAEGLDDEAEDNKLRHDAVISYLNLLYKPSLPDLLIKLICWVVSEYAYLAEENEPGEIIERVSGLLNRRLEDPQTCGWVISAVGKLAAQLGYLPDNVKQLLVCQCRTVSVDVRQRCHEILELNSDMTLMREVLPLDASCEEIEVDGGLSFLDELVSASLRQGMEAYTPKSLRNSCNLKEIEMEVSTPNFRFEPYEKPTLPMPKVHRESHTITLSASTVTPPGDVSAIPPEQTISQPNSSVSAPSTLSQRITNQLETKGNKTWSRDGYLSKDVRSGRTDSVFKPQSQSSNYKTQGDILTTEKAIQNQQLKEPTAEDLRKRNLAQALFGGAANSKIQQGIMKAKKQDKNKQTHGLNTLSDNTSVASTASAESGRNSSFGSQAGQSDSFSSGQGTNFTADKTADLLSKIDDDITNVSTRQGTDLTVHEHGNDFDQGIPQELDIRGDLLLLDLDGPVVKTDLSENNEIDIKQTDSFNKAVSINGEEIGNNLLENKAGSQTNVPSLLDSDISDNSSTVTTNMETSTSLPADLLAFPHSSDHQELCNDGTIRVTVQRVWSPRELVLALFITNQHNIEAISDVSVRVEPSSNLILSQAHQSLITEEKIHSSQSKIHIVEIKLKSPSLNTKLTGQVSYKDSTKTLKRTFFQSHTINISDFIRPLQLNTEEFGAKWTSTSNDKKDKIQSSLVSCQEFMDKAANILHLHAVQIIGCEGIAVGTILQSGICLLHGKIENGFVSLWVKSNSQLLSEAVLKQTINIFKL